MGIEPTRPAWKAGILAIELHPHLNIIYNNTNRLVSQEFLKKFSFFIINIDLITLVRLTLGCFFGKI